MYQAVGNDPASLVSGSGTEPFISAAVTVAGFFIPVVSYAPLPMTGGNCPIADALALLRYLKKL